MTVLEELLDEYVERHRQFGVPFVKAPPVSDQEIAGVERLLGTTIPETALELWRWSNGPGSMPEFEGKQVPALFPNGMHFMSLKQSAEMVVELRRLLFTGEFDDKELILDQFGPYPSLMVADSYETLQAVVSLSGPDAGAVWLWVSYGRGCRRCFDSVEDFVRLQLGFYEVGAVFVPDYPHPDLGYPDATVDGRDPALERLAVPDAWRIAWFTDAWDAWYGRSS